MHTSPRADSSRPGSGRAPAEIELGRVLAQRYEIVGTLGRGGFGEVYRAYDRKIGEAVALKLFRVVDGTDERATERLRRELRLARRISHPNVIRVHDMGESEDLRYISMELVQGSSLEQILNRRGKLPSGEALRIFRQVVDGVVAAHRRGVVHRDLKPGNIVLGEQGQVKVLDFGLAELAGLRGSDSGGVVRGTPAYMAPEQVEGERASQSADLYALGVILFEMLTGRVPFEEDTPLATALARLSRRPPHPRRWNPAVPDWLGNVVLRCMEREPADRFDSVADLLDILDRAERKEEDRPTDTLVIGIPARRRFGRALRRAARWLPAALAVAGMLLALPAIRDGLAPLLRGRPAIFEDGVVRVAVLDFEPITRDPVTGMIAAGLSETLRSRLAARAHVRVIGTSEAAESRAIADLADLGVEQMLAGRVGLIGGEVKILFSVTSLPGRERWMTRERSLQWEDSWERIDTVASEIASAYLARLERERLGAKDAR